MLTAKRLELCRYPRSPVKVRDWDNPLHKNVRRVLYGFVMSPLSHLTPSQGCADTFKGSNTPGSPRLALHPTVMWYQVITTPHLHRNSLHRKLSESFPRTRAKLMIEPLSNSPMNGLSASMKQTARIYFFRSFFEHTLLTVEDFPSTFPFRFTKKQNRETTHFKDRERFRWHHIWCHRATISAHS